MGFIPGMMADSIKGGGSKVNNMAMVPTLAATPISSMEFGTWESVPNGSQTLRYKK